MSIKLGLEGKLYYGVAGAKAATELTNVKDLTLNLETGEADITTRASQGWRATRATLKDGSIEFEMLWDTSDSGFAALKDAFFSNTPVALFVEEDTGVGFDADFSITKFTRNEKLEEGITASVTAKPTYATRAPQWTGGGGGG